MGKKEKNGDSSKVDEGHDEYVKHEKKKKKHSSKAKHLGNGGVDEDKIETIEYHEKKKKKKSKRKEVDSKNSDGEGVHQGRESATDDERNGKHGEKTILDLIDDEILEKKAKKKKRKKDKEKILSNNFLTEGYKQTVDLNDENEQKSGLEISVNNQVVQCKENGKTRKKKKRKRDTDDTIVENKYALDENDNVPKKKKKKLKDGKEEQETMSVDNIHHAVNDDGRKKKKRKHNVSDTKAGHDVLERSPKLQKESQMEDELVTNDTDNSVRKDKKKRKKDKRQEQVNSTSETEVQSKKVTDQQYEHPTGGLSNKKQEMKAAPTVGQWGTAQFESTERQNKFMRLLGGMKKKSQEGYSTGKKEKKGLFGGLAALSAKSGNSAMTSDQQNKWQTNMESQFNKALEYKGQRGGGLGFEKPPEEGKKFHINVHKSNSIKFDD